MEETWSPALRLRPAPVRAQAARGDVAAFASVYEQHHRALYRYCRSLLGNEEDARDALQSTMAKALAALRDEERDFELRPWLFRIAHNEAVSRLRQRRDTVDLDAAGAVGADSLPQAIEDRERIALLRSDLRDLPERQRASLVLRELCGLGHEEIAAVLDTTARGIKQTIFEARVALHECAEGRAMVCAEVQRALSDGDGRVLRARRMRAHVRSCRACRRFKAALVERPRDLAALVPATAGGGLLAQLLAGIEATGAVTTSVGGGVAATLAAKAAVIAATAATVAGTTTLVHSARHDARPPTPAPSVSRPAPRVPATLRPARATLRPARAPATPRATTAHRPARHKAPVHHRSPKRPPAPATAAPAPAVAVASAPPKPVIAAKAHPAHPAQSQRPAASPGRSQAANVKQAAKLVPPGLAKQGGAPPGAEQTQGNDREPAGQSKKDATDATPPGQAKK